MLLDKLRAPSVEWRWSRAHALAIVARIAPSLTLIIMAALATLAYGHGNIIGEGVADLHIDPVGFIRAMGYTWEPKSFLGSHGGFTQVYLTPYTFLYGALAAMHVPAELAQRCVIFALYWWIAAGMCWGLRYVAPAMHPVGRLAGAAAYLFNIYVAFNSAGSVPMLLTYGSLPWIAGAVAGGISGGLPALTAGAATAVFVFIGSGVNPPLIAINAIIIAIFLVVYLAWEGVTARAMGRVAVTALSGAVFSLALNLYWIVPFLSYIKSAWLAGVLDESPLMHNADSSFANVFRGLGQWSIFQSGPSGAYYTWAHAYQTGQLYSFLLWLVPICGIASLLFKARGTVGVPFFLVVCFISIPLAVGYYHGPLGDAITEPIYNLLYQYAPDFQMFRSAYKWVGAYEFGIAGLFAVFASYAYSALKGRMRAALACAAVALPLIVYVPVIVFKANYPMPPIPPWTKHESAMAGTAPSTRVALFPSQYLEQFQWGNPGYYIEHALIHKPMFNGYLGAATNEAADEWLRLAYRRTREGYPQALSIWRLLSVGEILQRDDFRSVQDFAFPESDVTSNVTTAHDDLSRVLGLRQISRSGANRLYDVPAPLPLVYGAAAPRIAPGPAVSVATSSDIASLAKGEPVVSIDGLSMPQVATLVQAGALGSDLPSVLDDYATTLSMSRGARVEAQYPQQPFEIAKTGTYRVAAMNLGMDYTYPIAAVRIDGRRFVARGQGAHSWQYLGMVRMNAGVHHVTVENSGYLTPILIVFSKASTWQAEREKLTTLFEKSQAHTVTLPIKRHSAGLTVDAAGTYRISATAGGLPPPLYQTFPLTPADTQHTAPKIASPRTRSFQLPYVLSGGVDPAEIQPLPGSWYESPETFDWNRGSATYWWLLSNDARFSVYSSSNRPVHAVLHLRIAPLGGPHKIIVSTGLGHAVIDVLGSGVSLPPAPRALAAYLTLPKEFDVPVELRPGYTTVRLRSYGSSGLPPDAVTNLLLQEQKRYTAAVAADMAFVTRDSAASNGYRPNTSIRAAGVPGGQIITVPPFSRGVETFPLTTDRLSLAGDPFLQGRIIELKNQSKRLWIGETIEERGTAYYRLFPIENPSQFQLSLAQLLPNSASDLHASITGLWLIASRAESARKAQPSVFALMDFGLMRTGMLPGILAAKSMPLRVDGKTVTGTVRLGAGRHRISAASGEGALDTVTIARGPVPQSNRARLDVQYVSPTTIVATVRKATTPFLLVLNEEYYPQWQARVGKAALLHVQANGFANGWLVPKSAAGTKIVINFTVQRQFITAVYVSAIAAVAVLICLIGGLFWRSARA